MQVFFAPGIAGKDYVLDEKESRHTIKVLRMRKGEQVRLIDGKGSLYEGRISIDDPKKCLIEIVNVTRSFGKRNYRLHIAISPLKNPDRFEWFIEKSVEIGIDEITPLICRNTEKKAIKPERLESIIISAAKQSLKAQLPLLNEPVEFSKLALKNSGYKGLIATCNEELHRKSISETVKRGENVMILIGPEGDFSEEELKLALREEYIPVHLGTSRLRTETAGLAACHSVYFINQ
jgi:16S rRNA (uracil1498-N3)-methyltransferase